MRRGLHALLIGFLIAGQPLSPATIAVGGGCTLADAITAANTDVAVGGCSAGAGVDVIELTTDVSLTTELPQVTSGIALEGNEFAISRAPGAPDFRILDLRVDGAVALRNVTISNGSTTTSGGGIYNDATVLSLTNARITDNQATVYGGGIMAGDQSELIWMSGSTVSGNQAGNAGGGLYQGWGVETRISGSTLSGNSAGYVGGAVLQGEYSYLNMTNSTVSGNSAQDAGGGIYATFFSYQTNLFNSTVIGNSAAAGGGVVFDVALYHTDDGVLADTVMVANAGGNCLAVSDFVDVHDLGGNFDDDGSCVGASPAAAGVDIDATLADNGGPTSTHAVMPGSVLIDAGGPCGFENDQRALPRDPICDSGAVEFDPAPVGGTLTGALGVSAICTDTTTGQSVSFPLSGGATSWDCESEGLAVNPGNTIKQDIRGSVINGTAGSIVGLIPERASCRNTTTGQRVDLSLSSPSWDCVEAGLSVTAGDRVRVITWGAVP